MKLFFSYASYHFFERILNLVVMLTIAKLLLELEFATYNQIFINISVILPVLMLGMSITLIKFSSKNNKHLFDKFWAVSILLSTILFLFCMSLLFLLGNLNKFMIFPSNHIWALFPLSILLLGEILGEYNIAFWRSKLLIIELSIYSSIKALIKSSIILFLFIFEQSFFSSIMIISLIYLTYNVYFTVHIFLMKIKQKQFFIDIKKNIIESIRITLPVYIYSSLLPFCLLIDRYIIINNDLDEHLAAYALSFSFASILGSLYGIINYIYYPKRAIMEQNESIKKINKQKILIKTNFLIFSSFIGFLILLILPFILKNLGITFHKEVERYLPLHLIIYQIFGLITFQSSDLIVKNKMNRPNIIVIIIIINLIITGNYIINISIFCLQINIIISMFLIFLFSEKLSFKENLVKLKEIHFLIPIFIFWIYCFFYNSFFIDFMYLKFFIFLLILLISPIIIIRNLIPLLKL